MLYLKMRYTKLKYIFHEHNFINSFFMTDFDSIKLK